MTGSFPRPPSLIRYPRLLSPDERRGRDRTLTQVCSTRAVCCYHDDSTRSSMRMPGGVLYNAVM